MRSEREEAPVILKRTPPRCSPAFVDTLGWNEERGNYPRRNPVLPVFAISPDGILLSSEEYPLLSDRTPKFASRPFAVLYLPLPRLNP